MEEESISHLRAQVETSENSEHHFSNEEPKVTEKEFALQTLERYAGCSPSLFCKHILLTNFPQYVEHFATEFSAEKFEGSMFKVAHANKIEVTILDFKIGSPAAALVVDLISFLPVKTVLMLGMCGGLRRRYKIGDFFMPVASIRGEGTSLHYFSKEVPALSNFLMSRAISTVLDEEKVPHHIGITHTTNIRFWEFDENFKAKLTSSRAQAIEMECATIFISGYFRRISIGALLLVSDLPLVNAKTNEVVKKIYKTKMKEHVDLGVKILHKSATLLRDKKKGSYENEEGK